MKAKELKLKYNIAPDTGEDMTPRFQAFIDEEKEPYMQLKAGEYIFKGTLHIRADADPDSTYGMLSIEGEGAKIKIESNLWIDCQCRKGIRERDISTVHLRDLEVTGPGATVVESQSIISIKYCNFHDLKTVARVSKEGFHTFKHLKINNVETAFELSHMAQFATFDSITAEDIGTFLFLRARTPVSTGIVVVRCHIKRSSKWAIDIDQGGGDTTYIYDSNFEECKGGVKLRASLFDKLWSCSFEKCGTGIEWMGCVNGGHISYSFFDECDRGVHMIGSGECSIGDCIFQNNKLDVEVTSCRWLGFNNNIFGEHSFEWNGSNGRCKVWDCSFKGKEPAWPVLCEHWNNFEDVDYLMRQTTFTEVDIPLVPIKRLGAGRFYKAEGNEFDGCGRGLTVIKGVKFEGESLRLRNLTLLDCEIDVKDLEIKDCVIRGKEVGFKASGEVDIDGLYMVQVQKGCQLKGCTGVIKNFLCVGNPDYFIEAENCHDMDFENIIAATETKDVKLTRCKNMRFNFGGLDGFTEHKWEITECDGIDIRNMFMSSARSACLIEKRSMNLTMSDCTLNWSDDVVDGLARIERIAINQCKRVKNMIGGFVYDRGEVIECKGVFRPEDNIEEWCGEEEDWKYYHFKNQDGPCTLKYNSGWREGNKIIVCDVNWFASLIMVSKRRIKGKVKIKVTRPRTRYGWDESKLHGAIVGWSDKMGPKVMKRIEDEWEGEVDGYLTIGGVAYGAAGVEVEYWVDEIK